MVVEFFAFPKTMLRSVIRLSRRHEWAIYLVTGVVFVTGAGWAWLHYFVPASSEIDNAFHSATKWMLNLHGAAAMATLIALGTLLPYHVKFAWRARRNRRTGSTLLVTLTVLIVSGYGLYYIGDERLRAWTSYSHLWVGLVLPLFLASHVARGKRRNPP